MGGYLDDNLPFGRNVAECPAFYVYSMLVYFKRRDKFSADSPETMLSKTILAVLPDVQDWQLSCVDMRTQIKFRFHDPAQRDVALQAVITSTPIELFVSKVVYENEASTTFPTGQVFPAPPPPPPPFPDITPIITDLETRVHAIEVEEADEPGPTREVVLILTAPAPAGAIFNIQNGSIVPSGSATLQGDVPPNGVTLPSTGAAFVANATAAVLLNGLDQLKGAGYGMNDAQWVSPTQIALAVQVFAGDRVTVRCSPPPP